MPESNTLHGSTPSPAPDTPISPQTFPLWVVPSVVLVALVYLWGLALLPVSGVPFDLNGFTLIRKWITFMTVAYLGGAFWLLVKVGIDREPKPARAMLERIRQNRAQIAWMSLGFLLVGLATAGFGWVKVQLNFAFPFWADRLWADMDHAIFGQDPYIPFRALLGTGVDFIDLVYSLWFPATVISVTGVFLLRDDVAIVAYFMIWGLLGLGIQAIGSSAGPIFWSRIGLGDRFDQVAFDVPYGSMNASNYLWAIYTEQATAIGGGISAMPSLHVGMAAWIAIAFSRTRLGLPAALLAFAYWIVVFLGSVALGWHYFMDGAIATMMTALAFALARFIIAYQERRRAAAPAIEPR